MRCCFFLSAFGAPAMAPVALRLAWLPLLACGAWAPALLAQDFKNYTVEKVAGGFTFTEGPVWSRQNALYFSDVPNNKIHKITAGEKGVAVFRDNSNGANGNTFDGQGRLLTCESRTRRVTRTGKDGKVEVLAETYNGQRLNAPNDITVRKDGNIYFTDPAFGDQAKGREMDFYGIYQITPKGELVLVAKTPGRPNGIALSPQGNLLYVADSDEKIVRVFDVDKNGKATNGRTFVSGIDGPPDGIRTDEKGNLWVTCNAVVAYGPDGKQLGRIEIAEQPRNLAFGEQDFQSLFVTAFTSVYRIRIGVKGHIAY